MPNHKETTESSSNINAQLLSSMNDIERKLRELEIKSNVEPLAAKLEHVSSRLDKLEENNSVRSRQTFSKPPEVTNTAQVTPSRRSDNSRVNYTQGFSDIPPRFNEYNSQTRPLGNFPISSEAESHSSEVQSDFRQIRDRLNKVEIPQSHKLNADRTGVKREDQVKFNVLASCSKYSETLLKVVAAASQEGADSEQILNSVYTVALAQQKYIQDEYASLLVSSSFDAPTARFFKQLQKNTSTFTPEALSHLHAAATIAAAHQPQSQPDQYSRGRGNSRYNSKRGRYRGQVQGDVYQRMTGSSQFPDSRPQHD